MSTCEEHQWTKLQPAPDDIQFGDTASISDHEFVIGSAVSPAHTSWGFYKYNNHHDEWQKFVPYPADFTTKWQKLVFNTKSHKLHSFDAEGQFTAMDIASNQFEINTTSLKNNIGSCLLSIDGDIHVIGGERNGKHLAWSEVDSAWTEIYNFSEEYRGSPHLAYSSAVYVKSKNIVLLFGGFSGVFESMLRTLWVYSVNSKTWTKVRDGEFKLNLWGMRSAVTWNEQHVIIVGGINPDNEGTDYIHVLSINEDDTYTLKRSKVRAPKAACHHVERMGGERDEILVVGYLRLLFETQAFEQMTLIPQYLMQIVAGFYAQEEIHWIERVRDDMPTDNQHFAISLKAILSSLEEL